MKTSTYLNQKKEIQKNLLDFLGNENEDETLIKYTALNESVENQEESYKIQNNREELRLFLYLLIRIINDFHRSPSFFAKIGIILRSISQYITQKLSNCERLDIFKKSKLALLLSIENNCLELDDTVISYIKSQVDVDGTKLCHFFYPEIKKFEKDIEFVEKTEKELLALDPEILTNFEEKRKIGENDSYICELIRKDSIEEFISYVTRNNISVSGKIKHSIFETNNFLIKNQKTTLIEYAAFYGSIQIFRFLSINGVDLNSILWLYAIHSNSGVMIHLLEENNIKSEDKSYKKCFRESIKCHHIEITKYITNLYYEEKNDCSSSSSLITKNNDFALPIDDKDNENSMAYSFHYYNYLFFPKDIYKDCIIYYLCQYDYFELVKLLTSKENFDMKSTTLNGISIIVFL